jgi:hypothetical protein
MVSEKRKGRTHQTALKTSAGQPPTDEDDDPKSAGYAVPADEEEPVTKDAVPTYTVDEEPTPKPAGREF